MIAFIVGSGFYEMEGFVPEGHTTPFGEATLLRGAVEGNDCLLLPRHGAGHKLLPHQINHRANLWALREAGATSVVSCSVCGVVHPEWEIGRPLVAEDLYFPENRLGDGSPCTMFTTPGAPGRGHLLAASLFNTELTKEVRKILTNGKTPVQRGCYGHVIGPRFNTPVEIQALARSGVDFISQTCGPEAVLCNELELPYALVGFAIDYANGVRPEPTPLEVLQENLGKAKIVFETVIHTLVLRSPKTKFDNFIYRFP